MLRIRPTLAVPVFFLFACGGAATPGGAGGDPSSGSGGQAVASDCKYEGVAYQDGSSFPSTDGCNTCSCSAGNVACTEKACLPSVACGARAGNSCQANEYCAYVLGQLCGQADAQAHCATRPEACPTIYEPVCGCDGKTYSNGCAANGAGTGLMSNGECPTRAD